jgi:hypothetical protein
MKLNTMAAVMNFISRIESASSALYLTCAERYPLLEGTFLSLATENQKFEKMVQQKYFGVITDAIEAGFSFELLDTDDYNLELVLPEHATPLEGLSRALELEHTIIDFYLKAAEVSTGLMADLPRAFRKIAGTRKERCLTLEAMVKGL